MSWLDTFRGQLDAAEITNPAKLYTPFTLFTIFFVLYFNAELFGAIFLADEWKVKAEALSQLGERGFQDWCWIVFKVFGAALLLTVAYGLVTVLSSFVWGISSLLSVLAAKKSNEKGYVSQTVFNEKLNRVHELELSEKELYRRLGEYHTWKPDDIDRLTNDLMKSGEIISKQENVKKVLETDVQNASQKLEGAEKAQQYLLGGCEFFKVYRDTYKGLDLLRGYAEAAQQWHLKDELFVAIEIFRLWEDVETLVHGSGVREVRVQNLNDAAGRFAAMVEFYKLGDSRISDFTDRVLEGNSIGFSFTSNASELAVWMTRFIDDADYKMARMSMDKKSDVYKRVASIVQLEEHVHEVGVIEKTILHELLGWAFAERLIAKHSEIEKDQLQELRKKPFKN